MSLPTKIYVLKMLIKHKNEFLQLKRNKFRIQMIELRGNYEI